MHSCTKHGSSLEEMVSAISDQVCHIIDSLFGPRCRIKKSYIDCMGQLKTLLYILLAFIASKSRVTAEEALSEIAKYDPIPDF